MPTYEFECIDCGTHFDVFVPISKKEKGLKLTCPQCGSEAVEEVFGSFISVPRSGGSYRAPGGGGCCPR